MDIREVVLMQDNTSTILLENNGRASSTKQTKHIDIWYFYVKKVDSKDVIVEYCPTEHMRADFFTKPLHGNLFNGYDLRSWVLIQAVHTTQISGDEKQSRDENEKQSPMRNSPTPPSVTEVDTGY